MARDLLPRWTITIIQDAQPDGSLKKTVRFDGKAGDADADNDFDRGPWPVIFELPYEKVKTLEQIEAIALSLAGVKVGK